MEYHVPSVDLSMRILRLLSRYKYQRCTLKQISDLLEANPTTCLRVLRTLARGDFVQFEPETKKYSLGPYLIPLGNRALALSGTVGLAVKELESICEATGLTTVLIQRLQDDTLVYIGSEEPLYEDVKITVSVGQQFAIERVAFGRCFIAFDGKSERDRFVQDRVVQSGLSQGEAQQITLRLEEIRYKGYVVSHGELTPGISSFTTPIFNRDGHVDFAFACLAMTSQCNTGMENSVVNTLLEKSRKLSELNGWDRSQFR